MLLRDACLINGPSQSVNGAVITYNSVPNGQNDPLPEHSEIKVDRFLTCLIQLGEPVNVLIVDVLLHGVGKKTGPRSPNRIIHHLEPVDKEDLA